MKLKQVKLSGFKSFVDATTINVSGGLIGIVGPNGCGKSNVIDAIRWVLGESSAKQLRGESMQDVIFNGSLNRKAVSRASVELIFDNSIKIISGMWSVYDEISIKRLISRSGDSVYYINNQVVRRKDITELFLGTGVGSRGYAIIEQGMISRVIDAKPEELRVYLEEAAGVSKYREKKKDTVGKLQDTKDNLVRIEDQNSGLEKQIDSLSIQAEAAYEYQSLQNDLKLQQVILNKLKIANSNAILNEINANIIEIGRETEEIEIALENCNEKLELELMAKVSEDRELGELTEKFNLLRTNIARYEERIAHNKNLYQRIEADKQRLSEESSSLGIQISDAQKQLAEFEITIANNSNEIEKTQITKDDKSSKLEVAFDKYNQSCEELNQKLLEINDKKHDLDILRNTYEHKKQLLQTLNTKLKKLEQEKAENIFDFNQSYFAIKDEIADLENELTHINSELQVIKPLKLELDAKISELVSAVNDIKSEKTAAESKLATINELLHKQIAVAEKGDSFVNSDDILSLLWQNIEVNPGYELAVEVVLGDMLNAVHIAGFDKIKQQPDNLFTFWISSREKVNLNKAQKGKDTLDKFVTVKDDRLENVCSVLNKYFVSDNYDAALSLVEKLENEQQIVTKDGHLLSKEYVIFNALSSQNHVLEYQNKANFLEQELEILVSQLAKLEDELVQSKTTCSKYEHDLTRLEDLNSSTLSKKHELQLKFTKEEQLFIQNKQYQEKVIKESELCLAEIEHANSELDEINIKLEDGEIDIEYLREKLNLSQLNKEELESEYTLAKADLQKLDEYIHSKTTDNQILNNKVESINSSISEKKESIKRNSSKIESLDADAGNLIGKDNAHELELMQDEIVLLSSTIEEKNVKINSLAQLIANLRDQVTKATKQKDQLAIKLNQLTLKQQEQTLLIQNYNEGLSVVGNDIDEENIEIVDEKRSIPEIAAQIDLLNSKIEKLGLVNLKAIEDLEHCITSHQEVLARVTDLKEAMAMLEDAILQIDKDTRILMSETYEKVNRAFQVYFKTLFGGGSSTLELTDQDILHAGMQMFASPPGKKNSSIQLLSGGEKALTAMSLVFAFFDLNPAPFCLLDEVDAPLDDANTSRFCSLVQELASKTQFIYISHNRLTMEMADQLVGVTMQEKGVSATVSVSLVEALKHAV